MAAQRKPSDSQQPSQRPNLALAAETLHVAGHPPAPAAPDKDEDKLSVFWRVFGGTLLSIVALLLVTAYQSVSGSISDLRQGIGRVCEAQSELVKKDDLNSRMNTVWSGMKELNGLVPDMKARTLQLEAQLKVSEQERKELAEKVGKLTERLARLEARQGAGPSPKVKVPAPEPAD